MDGLAPLPLPNLLPDIPFGAGGQPNMVPDSSPTRNALPETTASATTSISTASASTSALGTATSAQTTQPTSIPTSSAIAVNSATQATQPFPPNNQSNVGAIAGGIVGSLAVLALLVFSLVWLLRRRTASNHVKLPSAHENPMPDGGTGPGDSRSLSAMKSMGTCDPGTVYEDEVANTLAEEAYHLNSLRHPSSSQGRLKDEKAPVQIIHELPGSPVGSELESGQRFHAFRPR